MAVICALCCKKMVRIQERTNVNIRPVFNNSFAFSGWPAAFSCATQRERASSVPSQEKEMPRAYKNAIEKSHKTGDKTCNGQNSCSTDESALSGHNRLLYI